MNIKSITTKNYLLVISRYQIGLLTKRVRPIRIINMLCPKEVVLNVCSEDTFNKIQQRYLMFNSDAASYNWT